MKDELFAFPAIHDKHFQEGMTLRDYFAAKAMQGMFTTAASPCLGGLQGHEIITARAAYAMADALLAAS